MTENKYYTPCIEEFHIGFEYELFYDLIRHKDPSTANKWNKQVYNGLDFLTIYNRYIDGKFVGTERVLDLFDKHIAENLLRVKYLDELDILDLLFIIVNKHKDYLPLSNGTFVSDRTYGLSKEGCIPFSLYMDYTNSRVLIKYPLSDGEVAFQGVIKNKSELVKVLKMIGV